MNARDRIAEALKDGDLIRVGKQWLPLTQVERGRIADVMLAVLPDLLTDPEVVEAAASELRRWEVEAVAGINYEATSFVTRQVLATAAKALTGDAP